ncbi:MAG: sigma-70 family RNA polymerase sigma factor [Pseudoflavonifractor sp.]|nr:sigma-70 family RNA polymerase sigma factor [Pseudoflavonifractor sp.]
MSGTRYRKGGMYAADMAVYARALSEQNTNEKDLKEMKINLLVAMRQEISPKQREYLNLYYSEGLSMTQIGEQMGVDKSTVSRTIKRGEARLKRCLKFGAGRLLAEVDVETPFHAVAQRVKRERYENC